MKEASNDRRVLRTRQLLSHALTELMQEKRYERITVQDIIDRANVGRSTFYAHFENKDDLLVSDFERVMDMLGEHMDREEGDGMLISLEMFGHIQEHQHLYKALLWGRGIELLFEQGQAYLTARIEEHLTKHLPDEFEPVVPLPLLANHLSGALLAMIKWWLGTDMPYSPERMDEMYRQLVMPGVRAALRMSKSS
jgi:AcrR family transcriptional regulator